MTNPDSKRTDAVLVAAFQAGDERAFELLVERHRPALVRYAAGRLGAGDAEDVVQDAFLRAHRALSGSTTPKDLQAWLYVIVRNVCIDAVRAHARRPTTELHDHAGESGGDPAEVYLGRQRFAEVVSAIHALPSRQRDALVAVELDDRSYEDLAAANATSPGAVKSLINRARVTVREASAAAVTLPPLALYRLRGAATWLRDAPEVVAGAVLGKAGIAAVSAVSAVAVVATVPKPGLEPAMPAEQAAIVEAAPGGVRGGDATLSAPPGRRSNRDARAARPPAGGGSSAIAALRDCASGQSLGDRYSAATLTQARRELPTDVAEYTTCEDDLRRAIISARA